MPELRRSADCNLYFETYGFSPGEAPEATPILFLNGMTQTTMSWKSLARSLRATTPVIAYDARGQGASGIGSRELSLSLHAADLVALLDELALERVHLVGFSHGSRVALAAAAEYPDRVDHLVLTSATAIPSALARTIIRSWREILSSGGLEAMSWAALPAILGDAYLERHESLIPGIIRAGVQRNDPDGVAKLLDGMLSYPDLGDLARQVSSPTRVIYGEHDLLVDRDGANQLAALCSAEAVEIAGVGHTVPIEAPEAFLDALNAFLP